MEVVLWVVALIVIVISLSVIVIATVVVLTMIVPLSTGWSSISIDVHGNQGVVHPSCHRPY